MKNLMIGVAGFMVMLLLLTTSASIAAQEQELDPESVIRATLGALDAGDAETAVSYVAEDAVIVLLPPALGGEENVLQGQEAIGDWWGFIADDNGQHELWDFHVDGNKVTWKATIWGDYFRDLGMKAPLEADCVGIVEDGLLQSYTWKATDESMARLAAAEARQANEMLVNRFFEELWHEQNLDLADELLSEDFVSYAFPQGGLEEFKASVTGFWSDFPDGYFVIDEMIVTDDRVVVRGDTAPVRPAEGEEPERLGAWILVLGVKDGKISERWVAFEPTE
jgi:hypothetical protein